MYRCRAVLTAWTGVDVQGLRTLVFTSENRADVDEDGDWQEAAALSVIPADLHRLACLGTTLLQAA